MSASAIQLQWSKFAYSLFLSQLGFLNLVFNCLSELVQEADDVALCLATSCCMIL
ncbi:hypothetical protein A2U01_0022744 [Trifolium medium]|uniref:Uncharacterized protein n=1 Tax=Trifolium medium TaxID=97028 RepID=A0A392NPC4_9FABA|nr:hypothetical protein [Trifolium medium]